MPEKLENETENRKCMVKVYSLHLRLKNGRIIGDKAPLPSVGFEPTTTEFRSDALTD